MSTVNVRNIVIGKGTPKICVSIVGKTKEGLLSEVEVLKSVPVDVVEWRMDWFGEVECCGRAVTMLQVLHEAMPEMPILATFHSKKEDEELEISTAAYVELNKAIIDNGNVDLIGTELSTGEAQAKELIAHTHDKGVRVIMFNYDFDETPSYNEILTCLKAVQTLGANIPEIAVIPTCKTDVITLLRVANDVRENSADRPITTTSMVDTGVLSRSCEEVFGSILTFNAAKEASAPEQTDVEDLKTVLSLPHKSL